MKKLPENITELDGQYVKPCIKCGAFIFHKYPSQLKKRRYCSHNCHLKGNLFREGHKPKNAFTSRDTVGENNVNWKGDEVGYDALHDWVSRKLGRPKKCEHCGLNDSSRRYEWANKSHKYKRELDDWIRLCKKCHMRYDDAMTKHWITRKAKNVGT